MAAADPGRIARGLQAEAEAGGAAGGCRVNVQAELRWLKARVAALEGRRTRHKRTAAPRPDDGVVSERVKLWSKYLLLEMQFGHGRMRLTKLAFAVKWRLNPDEFCRWFSASDRRGIPAGSSPDIAISRGAERCDQRVGRAACRPWATFPREHASLPRFRRAAALTSRT